MNIEPQYAYVTLTCERTILFISVPMIKSSPLGMALYYDAASILLSSDDRGSLKSRIYGSTSTKSKPAQIYALIIETSKRDTFLKGVIDNAQLLADEPKVCLSPSWLDVIAD